MARSVAVPYGRLRPHPLPAEISLSVLDPSPVHSGQNAADAIAETVELARAAERFGYRRYWVGEHHGSEAYAGTAPEILLAHLAAVTSSMRIGSGGVLLEHYAPLKVAEIFKVLDALHPGRIDMGIGRVTGEDDAATHALRKRTRIAGNRRFPDQLADLLEFLSNRVPWQYRNAGVRAQPVGQTLLQPWLIGSSRHGATLAAHFGIAFSFEHFIDPARTAEVLRHYRRKFRSSAWLASPLASVSVVVLCADTEQEANRLALSDELWRVETGKRLSGPQASAAAAYGCIEQDRRPMADQGHRLVGAPEQVRDRVLELSSAIEVREIVVLTPCLDPAARRRSYQLLAQAFDLQGRSCLSAGRTSNRYWADGIRAGAVGPRIAGRARAHAGSVP